MTSPPTPNRPSTCGNVSGRRDLNPRPLDPQQPGGPAACSTTFCPGRFEHKPAESRSRCMGLLEELLKNALCPWRDLLVGVEVPADAKRVLNVVNSGEFSEVAQVVHVAGACG